MEPARVTEMPKRGEELKSYASPADGLIVLGVIVLVLAVMLLAGPAWALALLGVALVGGGVAMGRAGR